MKRRVTTPSPLPPWMMVTVVSVALVDEGVFVYSGRLK